MTATFLINIERLEAMAFAEAARTHEPCPIEYGKDNTATAVIGGIKYQAPLPTKAAS